MAAKIVLPDEELREEAGSTVYDAIYVAAAMANNATLLTADERLVNAVGSRIGYTT